MKKRILSILLALCMVLTLLPVAAFAAEEATQYELDEDGTIDTVPYMIYAPSGPRIMHNGGTATNHCQPNWKEQGTTMLTNHASDRWSPTDDLWKFVEQTDGSYYIQGVTNSNYLTATASGTQLALSDQGVSFTVTHLSGGQYYIKNGNNYLTYSGGWKLLASASALNLYCEKSTSQPDPEQPTAPTTKPTVNADTELYQVVVMCEQKETLGNDHYWSYPKKNGWSTTAAQFTVGDVRANDLDNGTADDYPYICPVTPAHTLDEYLAYINGESTGHRMITTEETIPAAYYYWNATDGWTFLKTAEANPNVTFNQNNQVHEGTLTIHVTCAEETEQPDPDTDKPTTKPAVGNSALYQVDVQCQKHVDGDASCSDHWWSLYENPAAFSVGDIQANHTGYQEATYKWVCPVRPAETLDDYLAHLNSKISGVTHTMVSETLPTAWFYWDGESWILPQDANNEVRFNNNVGSLTLYATCEDGGEPDPGPDQPDPPSGEITWVTSLDIDGYDLFDKEPSQLPTTAGGKYLMLARSGVQGDTDVYALYLNPTACPANNGVTSSSILAAKLGFQGGQLVGYLAGSDTQVTLDKLLMTVTASGTGYNVSNSGQYLRMDTGLMAGDSAKALTITSVEGSEAYRIVGDRTLALYVQGKNASTANWHTNFWGPGADPGASGANGSSYIYFLHAHQDDGTTVKALDENGTEIEAESGRFTIPAGGSITVNGETTFTVPAFVKSLSVPQTRASKLTMDANGGFGVMGCEITMLDDTTAEGIDRSGAAGSGVTFARTADHRLYFAGEGEMTNYSAKNTDVPPWLNNIGDRRLVSVSIGPGVTSVGSNAFKATSLSALTLSEGLESIGDSAFEACRIETVTLPNTVTDIGNSAFRGCQALRSVTLPESVTSIGSNAFANCTRLRQVTVKGGLASLPNGAFQGISGHAPLSVIFEGALPTAAYSDFEGMFPFLHQNGAVLYAQTAPSDALVRSAGSDAYFAVLNGASLSGVELTPGILPVLPAKDGQDFTGWQVGATSAALPGGTAVSGQPAGTVFTARWGGAFTTACTVTIDGVGYTVAQGETMGEQMPADPVREGFRFGGWVDENNQPFTAETVVTGNMTITAVWTEIPTYTVTLNANGGVLAGRNTLTVREGGQVTLFQLPGVTRQGYTFDGWFTADGTRFAGAAITADTTLTARWTVQGSDPDPVTPVNPGGSSSGGSSSRPVTPPQETLEDPDVPLASAVFVDVDRSAWYAGAVSFVSSKQLMQGTSALTFEPSALLDRGMMAQIMYNMAGKPAGASASSFSDLKPGAYYADAVAWGVENKVLLGYGDGTFGGGDVLTREQMVVILYRYAQQKGADLTASPATLDAFRDRASLSGWAAPAMAWAVKNGLIQGRGGSTLAPLATITRAEAAAILERYAQKFPA